MIDFLERSSFSNVDSTDWNYGGRRVVGGSRKERRPALEYGESNADLYVRSLLGIGNDASKIEACYHAQPALIPVIPVAVSGALLTLTTDLLLKCKGFRNSGRRRGRLHRACRERRSREQERVRLFASSKD